LFPNNYLLLETSDAVCSFSTLSISNGSNEGDYWGEAQNSNLCYSDGNLYIIETPELTEFEPETNIKILLQDILNPKDFGEVGYF